LTKVALHLCTGCDEIEFMQVKIDTKQKFTVLTPTISHIYDNMAVELAAICHQYLQLVPKNVILNLSMVDIIDDTTATIITQLQQEFYENSASFVVCCIKPSVEDIFEKASLLFLVNATPTESQAWDIVQMEEIERELLDTDEAGFTGEE